MPAGSERRFAALERQRVELIGRLEPLSDAQHAFQPDRSSWSLAGVVHDLVLVEETFVRTVAPWRPGVRHASRCGRGCASRSCSP